MHKVLFADESVFVFIQQIEQVKHQVVVINVNLLSKCVLLKKRYLCFKRKPLVEFKLFWFYGSFKLRLVA